MPDKKRTRRGRGEGSIFQRKDGRWVAQVTLENGETRQYYAQSYQEALKLSRKVQQEKEQGRLATGPKQTVGQYLEYWLEIHRAPLKLSTYALYRRHLDNHLLPGLGSYQLRRLTADQVQAFYAKKQQEGISASTLRLLHVILDAALEDAVRRKRLSANVCTDVTLPRITRRDVQPLDQEQAKRLLAAAKGSPIESLLALALATGMRLGEILALRWSDINIAEKVLHVRHTVSFIQGHGYVETEPKTVSSHRVIALPQFVLVYAQAPSHSSDGDPATGRDRLAGAGARFHQ